MCQWMNGANPGSTTWPQANYIGWGTAMGSNASSVVMPAASNQASDVAPYSELSEARVVGTGSIVGNTAATTAVTYQLVGTITASSGESPAESFIGMAAAQSIGKGQCTVGVGATYNAAAVSLTVTTLANLPTSYPYQLQAGNEVVNVTAGAGTVLTTTRQYNGSGAQPTLPAGSILTVGNVPGSGGSNPHTADTFAHAGFQALALNTNDSIQFTWQITVSTTNPSFT